MIFVFVVFILTGALAGLLSGLIGIGGGVVVVPCLYYTLTTLNIPEYEIMQIVLGTSLATIAFNTLISASGHYRKKSVLMRPLKRMLPGLFVGSFVGATIAIYVSGSGLKYIFAGFEVLLGFYFFFAKSHPKPDNNNLPKSAGMALIGFLISTLSTLLGISGGVITVPMLLFYKVKTRQAIGTSAAASFVVGSIGTIAYLIYGFGRSKVDMTVGYIYLPAFLAICGGSLIVAPLAVELAHKLPTKVIKKFFAVILVIVGTIMFIK
ncbi:MAG: sulfite exporter TauE/SafE family protein [Rhabdochlamydiaceae bacterium]|nr:sulfite exporter TauE/SafE family protein [Candidatus Amphrikana amoebophyrae]